MTQANRRFEHGRRRGALAVVAALACALFPLVGPAQGSDGSLSVVGTLDRFPADSIAALGDRITSAYTGDDQSIFGGTLLDVPDLHQVWQIYPTVNSTTGMSGPTAVAVRDKTSLRLVRTFDIPVAIARSASSTRGGGWFHAFDGDRRAFFLGTTNADGKNTWSVVEVDLRTFATRNTVLGAPMVIDGRATTLVGPAAMEYDPYGIALLFLWSNSGSEATFAYRFDLVSRTGDFRHVRTCNGGLPPVGLGESYQLEGIVREDFVYFACQRYGAIGAVVRIPRDQFLRNDSVEDIVAGPAYLETSFADPQSGRIFLVTVAAEIWAFDVGAMSFVGVVSGAAEGEDNPRSAFGFDKETGRLYLLSPQLGIGVAEGRFFPIPQARTYPDMKGQARERIISNPRANTIFVLTGLATQRSLTYTIYDVGAAPVPPPPPDPDGNTADIDPSPGTTEARYFASGSGYGVRTLLAKGVQAVPPAPTLGQNAYTADVFAKHVNSKCGFTDRELVAGRVTKAEYDTGTTAAQAVGVDVDERTKLDVEHLSRCDVNVPSAAQVFKGIFSTVPEAVAKCDEAATEANKATEGSDDERECDSGRKWTTTAAYCTSSTGGDSAGDNESRNESPSRGAVECPQPGGTLKAGAVGYLTGAVAVGKAETNTVITRLAKGAVVSTVVAEAQDITMGDPQSPAFRIGRITATATSQSNGRPSKGQMSSYRLEIKGVSITTPAGSKVLCEEYAQVVRQAQQDRQSRNCDIDATLNALNIASFGRAEFGLANGIDPGLLRGSKGGALTAVQKSTARQASDQALMGDKTTEVPGLQVVIYNDNKPFGRARQLYQFAGVATAATYNIVPIPSGEGAGDLSGADIAEDDGFLSTSGDGVGMASTTSLESSSAMTPTSNVGALGGGGGGGGSFLGNAARALLRGIRLFFSNPRHAVLLLTAWALFGLPAVLASRRRLLLAARTD